MLKDFEKKLAEGFDSFGESCNKIFATGNTLLLGVSGGADSIALLQGCVRLKEEFFSNAGAEIFVITVNHNIRPQKESQADADFVSNLCKKLNVGYQVVHLLPGQVVKVAEQRGRGIEEAARFLRYNAFEKIAKEKGAYGVFLAHNRNDQLETLLMRFFQGSSGMAACGIKSQRDIFFRPMLNISRTEIESYLLELNHDFRKDSTNMDNSYLRNRIRNKLVPVLNEVLPGWDKAIISGAEKTHYDNELLESMVQNLNLEWQKKDECVFMDSSSFFSKKAALRLRLLYKGFSEIDSPNRVPYSLIKPFLKEKISFFSVQGNGIKIECNEKKIIISKVEKNKKEEATNINSGFFAIIHKTGSYKLLDTQIQVYSQKERDCFQKEEFLAFELPLVIRSLLPGDKILQNGMKKDVAQVLSSKNFVNINKDNLLFLERIIQDEVFVIPLIHSAKGFLLLKEASKKEMQGKVPTNYVLFFENL
ncbi:MAG: tRNA lysidine(34) synthetase TilS [Spirochaetaceae bacterium]|nr:tRNA lysidine(34) synthetase TilS [Spirochaetaceae bacterium]